LGKTASSVAFHIFRTPKILDTIQRKILGFNMKFKWTLSLIVLEQHSKLTYSEVYFQLQWGAKSWPQNDGFSFHLPE